MCKIYKKFEKNNVVNDNKKKRYIKIEIVYNKKNVTFYTIFFNKINKML